MNDIGVEVFQRYSAVVTERATYERFWQEIRELVRINTTNFQRQNSPGDVRSMNIYDATAQQSAEELASALHAYMSSPSERWFGLEVEGDLMTNRDPQVIAWCQQVAEVIYEEFRNDATGCVSAMQECYQDIATLGTSILFCGWNFEKNRLYFRSYPLSMIYCEENNLGMIDVIFRKLPMTPRQIVQEFGAEALDPKFVADSEQNRRKFDVIHAVFPNSDRIADRMDSGNKAFASVWLLAEDKKVLRQSGYDQQPYIVARWSKLSEEVYGRGPAINCLPEIRGLNRMELTMLKAMQKAVDPPLVVPNDGFMLPIATSPGAIIFKEPGAEKIEVLEHKGRLDLGMEKADQKRDFIRRAFFAEFVKLTQKKERQTAFEIQQLIEQQLKLMAPMLGRIQTEFHAPMIGRAYALLQRAGKIPPSPDQLRGKNLKIVYQSNAARAQVAAQADSMGRYAQELLPLAQVHPEIMDAIDTDKFAQEVARVRGIPSSILRSPKDLAALRAQKAQAQQMQQAAQIAQPASEAVKNLSQAQAAAPFP